MRRKIVMMTGIALMGLFLLVDCGSGDSDAGSGASGSPAKGSSEEVQLLESGYCLTEDCYLKYGFVIENPSKDTAFEFPVVTVTAYDENGEVLATGDQTMGKIQPGEKQAFASLMDCNGKKPDKVAFDIDTGDAIAPSDEAIRSSDFEIAGTNERTDEYDETAVTGTIKNNSASDTDSAAVTVLFRKEGKIVCGTTEFVDNLGAGKEKAFEAAEYGVPEHDAYEVTAIDWGI
ncbi:MAG: hypothetical protein IJI20_02120 [Firmicutes bacterium]|nr:hypothetical protein [Bacillota bacterium]